MKITEHFSLEEFKQPAMHNMSGLPYPEQWIKDRLTPLCQQLEIIREKLGGKPIRIVSGYRSPEYNTAINGAKQSQHIQGRAADIVVEGVDAYTVYSSIMQMVRAKVINIGGLGYYKKFTHVDIRTHKIGAITTWTGDRLEPSTAIA